ncbi:MAG: hypothetical protein JNJ86_06910 [Chitinophagaceae bacterium]|jgi:hypothetical protein|nr:hypothetical protein [Chitinophagaceae bacterium]
MKMRPDIDRKVQETLESLDGIQRAEPQPFFYTRLTGRLQHNEKTVWETMGSFISRPVVVIAGLFVILLVNAFMVLRQDTTTSNLGFVADQTEQLVTDNEYVLATNSSFDYENIDRP